MIAAIMQPYFFPYIGYFQLMAAVDTFVLLDDVQYVNRSWMNRNRIRFDGRAVWLSMPVEAGPRSANINERNYVLEARGALLRKVDAAYRGARYHPECRELLARILSYPEPNVAAFNAHLLEAVSDSLGARPRMLRSSTLRGVNRARGQDGILEICKLLGVSCYVNPIGGVGLYDESVFEQAGITLRFLRTLAPLDPLMDGEAHLSVIDAMMRDGSEHCAAMLASCEILNPSEVGCLS